jgi:hypothetical protein
MAKVALTLLVFALGYWQDIALAASQAFLEQAHAISLIYTYEGRLRREVERDQAQRKAVHERATRQVVLFVEHAESKGEVELARHRDRQFRLSAARIHHFDALHRYKDVPIAA